MVGTVLALSLLGLGAVRALPAQTVEERQTFGSGGGGSIIWSPDDPNDAPCQPDALTSGTTWAPCAFSPTTGSLNPPKEKRDGERVEARQFHLPPDANSNPKRVIEELERELEDLQNKRHKSWQDRQDIENIEDALEYLAGVTDITSPSGGSSTFTPGKRDSVGAFSAQCPDAQGAEDVLKLILQKDQLSRADYKLIQQLEHFLTACGLAISDGSATLIQPSNNKRDDTAAAALQESFASITQSLGDDKESLDTWLLLQSFADLVESQGLSVDRSLAASSASLVPRQVSIGGATCSSRVLTAYQLALAAITAAYPDPSKAPWDIRTYAQTLALVLQACGRSVSGWPATTLTPGTTIPGGSINPDPTIPGGPMIPDNGQPGGSLVPNPTVPGGSLVPNPTIPGGSLNPDPTHTGGAINPDPTKPGGSLNPPSVSPRDEVNDDSESLLASLRALEAQYGTYDSGKIPSSIFWTMSWIVVTLQNDGFVVMGWPTTTSLGPSN